MCPLGSCLKSKGPLESQNGDNNCSPLNQRYGRFAQRTCFSGMRSAYGLLLLKQRVIQFVCKLSWIFSSMLEYPASLDWRFKRHIGGRLAVSRPWTLSISLSTNIFSHICQYYNNKRGLLNRLSLIFI